MLFALAFFMQFLIGGLTGIFIASPVLDYHAYGSYFVVAHFHYTLFAGSVFGFFAGVYHWFPKLTGALLRESLGKLQLVLLVIGTNLTFFPMFILGQDGMPRRISRYPTHPGWGDARTCSRRSAPGHRDRGRSCSWPMSSSRCAARVPAGDDPWLGHTLEWATSSPPPRYNFDAPAAADPLLRAAARPAAGRSTASTPEVTAAMRGGAIPLLAWGRCCSCRARSTGSGTTRRSTARIAHRARWSSSVAGSRCRSRSPASRSGAARRSRDGPQALPEASVGAVALGLSVGCDRCSGSPGPRSSSTSGRRAGRVARLGSRSSCAPSAQRAGARSGREPAMSAPSLSKLLLSHWRLTRRSRPGDRSAALYWVGVRGWRGRWPAAPNASFLAGLACVLVALQSGIDAYDDRLLSVAHGPAHAAAARRAGAAARRSPAAARAADAAAAVAAPALPGADATPRRSGRRRSVRSRSSRPSSSLTHLPAFYDATLRHPPLHDAEHAVYLVAGLLVWWPLLDGDPPRAAGSDGWASSSTCSWRWCRWRSSAPI